jgi:hypothetical protein
LAVLAAEVMTVTNPLAFQTVLGWPGLQTIARFRYYHFFHTPPPLFFASDFCTVLGASCGGIGLWGAWQGRECTFISQQDMYTSLSKSSRREMPSSFHVIEARLHRQVDNLGTNGTVQAGGGRGKGVAREAPRLPSHRFSAQSHRLDR